MKRPITLMIKPSSSLCNLRCDYCFYFDEEKNRIDKNRTFMDEETIENIVKQAHSVSHNISYIFQGGEPALAGLPWFENFISLVERYKSENDSINYSFQTNGTLVTKEYCEFFFKHNFLVGVSFDGFSRIHDIYRKFADDSKSSRKVKQGLKLLKEYNVEHNILCVVTNEVANNIELIYNNLIKEGYDFHQYLACLDPIGIKDDNKYLDPIVYGKSLVELFDLWIKDLRNNKRVSIRLFNNFVSILLGNQPEACDMNGVCSIQYVFESDGDVFPCDFYCLDNYLLGNINKNTFEELDEKRKEINFIVSPPNLHEDCKVCPYLYLCRGGCPRYKDSNNKFRFCSSYKYLFNRRLEGFKQLAQAIAQNSR